jgi:hypothetical protein
MVAASNRRTGVAWAVLLVLLVPEVALAWEAAPASSLQQQVVLSVARDLRADPAVVGPRLEILTPLRDLPPVAGIHLISARREFAVGDWLLRLACTSSEICLPFDVVLHAGELSLASLHWQPSANMEGKWLRRESAGAAPLERPGQQVELVEKLVGVTLRTRAVCLESGSLGQSIRVRNISSGRVLEATIAGQGLVRLEQ